ncbi:MAG: HYR domain-containing protein [Lewinellaceae bacterium]|nr:HYR domain-containing protein [Lewinellaceae bacterium]
MITVWDETPPYFENCPSDITLNNDPGKCGAAVFWLDPVAEDNCNMETVVQSGGLAPVRTSRSITPRTRSNTQQSTAWAMKRPVRSR